MLLCVVVLGDGIDANFGFLLTTRIEAFKSQVNGIYCGYTASDSPSFWVLFTGGGRGAGTGAAGLEVSS